VTGAAGVRRGKFELADSGTIFLDEVAICTAPPRPSCCASCRRAKFHRVGGEQTIRVSVRVVSATNRDLSALVTQGKFREDLYYRLSVVPIRVPALRERPQDVKLQKGFGEPTEARRQIRGNDSRSGPHH
jgi:transcriptional regulator with GAF, ATPase, and Fis domain